MHVERRAPAPGFVLSESPAPPQPLLHPCKSEISGTRILVHTRSGRTGSVPGARRSVLRAQDGGQARHRGVVEQLAHAVVLALARAELLAHPLQDADRVQGVAAELEE